MTSSPTTEELDRLLEGLAQKNVDLWIDGDRLACGQGDATVTPDELELVDQWNDQLISRVREPGFLLRSYPLSLGQQGLLYLNQLMPRSASYHMAFPVRIHSSVDVEALERAIQTLVNRHACLRTVFEATAGEAMQHVLGFRTIELERIDCSAMDDAAMRALVADLYAKPFDLGHELPVRAHLLTRRLDDHVFMLNIHHIVTDGLSLWMLLTDLETAYGAEIAGTEPNFRPLGASYGEYVAWQRAMLTSDEGKANVQFWKTYLDGAPALLDLPTDRKRPPMPTGDGELMMFKFGDELLAAIQQFAERERVKLRTIFLAAYQVMLHRYSGQDDVLIAFETAGRPGLRLARTAGYFVNPIVFRSSFEGDMVSLDYLRKQEDQLAAILKHQSMPFVHLVDQIQFDRDAAYWPLAQVEFNFVRLPRGPQFEELMIYVDEPRLTQFAGMTASSYGLTQQVGQYDLSLTASQVRNEYWGGFKYSTDLFDAADIERMIDRYRSILGGLVGHHSDADVSIGRLPMMAAEEKRLAVDATTNLVERPACPTVVEMFEAAVARSPDATAVKCRGVSVSYRELNDLANQLAADLARRNVGPEVLVGVCLERSVSVVVALLGILKAGGAYAPLDPELPSSRLDFMVEDARIPVILTEPELDARLPSSSVELVYLDQYRQKPGSAAAADRSTPSTPDDLAYVVYTSGSTGRPKGVEVTHRALTNLLMSARRRPGLTDRDVLLSVTTLSFDIAAMEIFLPLVVGATVVIADTEDTHDGRRLGHLIDETEATFVQATPATWRLLVESGWKGRPEVTAVSAGEVLTPALAASLLPRTRSLWNGYGPSEATIYTTFHEVDAGDDPVPIGRALENVTLHILDEHLEPVPPGLIGELYVGGVGLARGYRYREVLTAERFVPDPFSPDPEARLYKTGDRVRRRSTGVLDFLGRTDHQVKIRGFRIELGEVEIALERHPAVQEAIAAVDADNQGHKRLISHIVPAGSPPTVTEIREFLRRQLPDYMVPSMLFAVDSFPLTPNGKVDRKALAAARPTLLHSEVDFEPATTEVELELEHIWRALIGVSRIDVNDRFHDIGGDSITLAQMVIRAGEAFGIDVPLTAAVEHPTIRGLGRFIEAAQGDPVHNAAITGREARPETTTAQQLPAERPGHRRLVGKVVLTVFRVFARLTTRMVVDGVEHLPASGPRILASNHINWLDFPLLGAVLSRTVLGADREPAWIAAMKWKKLFHPVFVQLGRPIYVRRGTGDLEALAAFRDVLSSGGVVAVAPEGTFDGGALVRGRTGTARIASDTGAAVIPAVVYGQDNALRSWRRLKRVPVRVRFGPPMLIPHGIGNQTDLQRETDRLMESLARLLPPERRGVYGYVSNRETDPE